MMATKNSKRSSAKQTAGEERFTATGKSIVILNNPNIKKQPMLNVQDFMELV